MSRKAWPNKVWFRVWEAEPERGVAQLRGKSNLRGKKLDPWRGANAAPKAPAVLPIIGGDSQRNLSQGNSRG